MAEIYNIPKEVKGENKIAFNLNAKQLIACTSALVLDVIIYFTLHLKVDEMMLVTLVLGFIAIFISSKTIDGVSFPHYVLNYAKKLAFHADIRKYRTKNRIIFRLNERYSELKEKDMQDKKIKRKIIREEKKRTGKKSRLKAVY